MKHQGVCAKADRSRRGARAPKDEWEEEDQDRQRHTETDRDRQRQIETDRERQRQTETVSIR